MKVYETRSLRNLAIAGHAGAGKTSLIEAMLHHTGSITRIGAVEDNNTVSDFHELEHERNCSVFSSVLFAEHNDKKINIIDTPGYDDYIGEMIAPMYVCDTAMIVINSSNGIEVGTENGLVYANKLNKPVFYVINKLDNDQSKFDEVLQDLKSQYGNKVTAFQYPLNPGNGFNKIIDLLSMKMLSYKDSTQPEISDIPADEMSIAEGLRNELIESVAETNEELMSIYFEEGSLTDEQLSTGLKKAFLKRDIFPVFAASSKTLAGVSAILDFVA
ncbi:MAG: GTP-binding protein, partial [Candidatus Kapaibacterium sp.]